MNALTFRPHLAWLVVNGYKDVDNNLIPTTVRGRVGIHANSSPVTPAEYERFRDMCRKFQIKKYPKRNGFQTEGIIGSVKIDGCVVDSNSFWFSGPYGYLLKHPRKTRFQSTKGKQVYFDAGDVDEYLKRTRSRTSLGRNTPLSKIKQSVREAQSRLLTDTTLGREIKLMCARERRLNPKQRLRERMLFSLQCTKKQKRDLRLPPIDKAILDALQENDIRFFIKLGRVLGSNPYSVDYEGRPSSQLSRFLLTYWAEPGGGVPALYTLSPNALAVACRHFLNNKHLTILAVGKQRQRLGLKTTRGRKLASFELVGGQLRFS